MNINHLKFIMNKLYRFFQYMYKLVNLLLRLSSTGERSNTHHVLDCTNDVIKDHCFWPLISDLVNIMSHKPIAVKFMSDSLLLDIWFEMIGFLQGNC